MNRCRLCPSRKLPIEGHGPTPCSIMFVGEAPGKTEDRTRDKEGHGMPFHGDAGQELNRVYLPLAGLRRSEVYVTNTVQCIPDDSGGNPSDTLARCCAQHHLPGEIATVQPDFIITLGAVAYHTMFPSLPPLEYQHGIPIPASYSNVWTGTLIPMYHPAAGLRSGRTMAMLVDDFKALPQHLSNPSREPGHLGIYDSLETSWDVEMAFDTLPPSPSTLPRPAVALDTEVYTLATMRPYCLSFSTQPGTGFIIHHQHQDALDELHYQITTRSLTTLLHNAPFDYPILSSLFRRPLPCNRIVDTMALAYHIGSIPQGLKPLAYRLLNVDMTDFDSLTLPYWHAALREWLGVVASQLEPAITTPGKKAPRNPNAPTLRKVRSLLSALSQSPIPPTLDPWKRWQGWNPHDHTIIAGAVQRLNEWREEMGVGVGDVSTTMPEVSICYVPWREVLSYAGADADMTLRLWPVLRAMGRRVGKGVGV